MSSSSLHQQFTKSNQTHPSNQTQDDLILSSETIEFAHKMFDAARSGNLNLLKSAIESGLPVDLTNSSGNTLLMLSSYSGHLELVNYLISKGSNPNRLNDLHQSPLSGSVFKDHRSIIHSLFQAGADPKLGQPNAIDCAYMFDKKEYWDLFGVTEKDVSANIPRSINSYLNSSSFQKKD